jgi:hypothetical protein
MAFDKDNFEEDNELAPLEEEEAGDVDEVAGVEIEESVADDDTEEEPEIPKRSSTKPKRGSASTSGSGRAASKPSAGRSSSRSGSGNGKRPAKKASVSKSKSSAGKSAKKKSGGARGKASKKTAKKASRGGKKKKR